MARPIASWAHLTFDEEHQLRRAAAGEPEPHDARSPEGRAWWSLIGRDLLRRGTRMDWDGREVAHGWAPTPAGRAVLATLDARAQGVDAALAGEGTENAGASIWGGLGGWAATPAEVARADGDDARPRRITADTQEQQL